YRGGISFTATDRAGNICAVYDDSPNAIVVVDGTAPLIEAAYIAPRQAVEAETLATAAEYGDGGHILYYDTAAYLTLSVTEPNFYAEDAELFINGLSAQRPPAWRASGDTHTARVAFGADGEYLVELRYADRSKNAGTGFVSERIVIDTTPPSIELKLLPEGRAREEGGRLYYGEPAKAEITVTERNFRAGDIVPVIKAVNSEGYAAAEESAAALAEYLLQSGSWTRVGDKVSALIEFPQDANYSLTIGYTDLALRGARSEEARLTVDTTPPSVPAVTYGESLNAGAGGFGYYNAPARVSVSVDDATSGISRIVYRYTDADGTARRGDIEIASDDIAYSNGGKTASVSFYAPAAGIAGGQFDGTVEVTAFDRSGNGAGRDGDRRVIVDSIAPELTVSYSAPVSARDGMSYYAGDIEVALRMRESNFEPRDVSVSVSRDGRTTGAVPIWSGRGGDYIGELTLSGDGEYSVSVAYADRSNNAMDAYESGRLVIDTAVPVISLRGVSGGMAYNDASVGFALTAGDANMDARTVAVRLRALKRADDGSFITADIPLEGPVLDGGAYAYASPNLEDDGIYTLTAQALDMSGNAAAGISTPPGGGAAQEIVFSVNRNGAAFLPDGETMKLVEAYYIRSVENDIRVAAIDVSPLVSYCVSLNGAQLDEGSHYAVARSGGDGRWSKYDFIIDKALFEAEGVYNLVVTSSDAAENRDFSDIKDARIGFAVDRTPPVLAVSGLVDRGRYRADKQTVTVMPRDDGGRLGSLLITLSDRRGAPINTGGAEKGVLVDLGGEELLEYLDKSGGSVTFRIPQGSGMTVEIVCEDVSADGTGARNRSVARYSDITVAGSGAAMFFSGGSPRILAAAALLALAAACAASRRASRRRKLRERLTDG
ncbi:MAG: hypothetical protein LBC21_02005, partial [Oscillospiraceae bacterium]|nr:hypothetical protein [Oscillospiraceae bacterium]